MSITPDQFLSFADKALSTSAADEFDFRNAASRAYYSAFHCCLSQRQRCPELAHSEISGSHDKLYNRFSQLVTLSNPENATVKSMSYMAQMMKSVRHNADYRINDPFLKEDAEQQISDARKVLLKWKTLPK